MKSLFPLHTAPRDPHEFIVVSWNLHKGRSPLGFQTWQAMRRWMQRIPADVYFLQEAMAHRRSAPRPTTEGDKSRVTTADEDWHCHATEISIALQLHLALGPNVHKPSWRHGNAILSSSPLTRGERWDISAHRFEQRGLLVTRTIVNQRPVILLCVHLALTRAARLRQMEWLAHWIVREAPSGPLILAGDFNDWQSDSIPIFHALGLCEVAITLGQTAKTFPAFSPALALDKMFVREFTPMELVPAAKAAWLSDHLPYIARLRLTPPTLIQQKITL